MPKNTAAAAAEENATPKTITVEEAEAAKQEALDAFAKAHLEPLVSRVNALASEVVLLKQRLSSTTNKVDELKAKILDNSPPAAA